MAFYVFDLDGTIADCQHRAPSWTGAWIDGFVSDAYRAVIVS